MKNQPNNHSATDYVKTDFLWGDELGNFELPDVCDIPELQTC